MVQLTYYIAPWDREEPDQEPGWAPPPDDIHTLRFGYNLADLEQLARMALTRAHGGTLDYQTRYDVAWSATAEALYAAEQPPTPADLIAAAQDAVAKHVRHEMRHHGRDHHNIGEIMPRFAAYWMTPPGSPGFEDTVVDRIALWQIWPHLTDRQRQVLLALAATGDYQRAAEALDANPGTFRVNLAEGRRRFLTSWHQDETPSRMWGTDRRVSTRTTGSAPTEPTRRQPVTRTITRRKGRPKREPVHGSASTYTNHGCRCAPCTRAQAEQTAARRRAQGAKPRRRVTVSQLDDIRRRRDAGESVYAIAADLGFTNSYLYRLLSGTLQPAPDPTEEVDIP